MSNSLIFNVKYNTDGSLINPFTDLIDRTKNKFSEIRLKIKFGDFLAEPSEMLKKYNQGLKELADGANATAYAEQFLKDNQDKLTKSEIKLISANKGVEVSNKGMATSAKVATVATKALNMVVNMAVMWAISAALQAASKKISEYANATKNATQKVDELNSSLSELKGELETLTSKDQITPEESARIEYLKQRIELEEKLLGIAERKQASAEIGDNHDYTRGLDLYVADKDSYAYKASREFYGYMTKDIDFINDAYANNVQTGWDTFLDDLHRQTYYALFNDSRKIADKQRHINEFGDHGTDSYKKETEENTKEAEKMYDKLIDKYSDYNDEISTIQTRLLNPNLSQKQRKEYQQLLELYQQGANNIKDEINNFAVTFNKVDWIIYPEFEFDFSESSIAEYKKKFEEYLDKMLDALGVYKEEQRINIKFSYGFYSQDGNNLYNAYADAARNAAEKFGDYTEEYSQGNLQKTYDFSFIDEIAVRQKIQTEDQINYLNQAIEKAETRNDIETEYLNILKEETSKELLDYANTKDKSKYTGAQYVDDAQSEIKQLGDILKQLQDDTLDESSLIDFYQDFPEFQNITTDLQEAIKIKLVGAIKDLEEATGKKLPPELRSSLEELVLNATNANRVLSETFNQAKTSFETFNELQKKLKSGEIIDNSILSSIAGISDRLDTMVAGYYGGVVTIQEIYEELDRQRQQDFENYKETYVRKQNLDNQYYENAITSNANLVNAYNKMYHTDLENYNNFEEAKLNTFNEAIRQRAETLAKFFNLSQNQMANMLSKYYDYENNEYTSAYKQLVADARSGGASAEHANIILAQVDAYIADYQAGYEQLKQFGMYSDELFDIKGFANNIKDVASSYEELFDFFERRIEVIDQALNKLDASLENVNGSMSKNILIAGKIGIVSEEIKDYSSALIMYEDQANKELAKLDADLQDKIKNGAVDLTKLMGEGGEEVNKILTEYQNWANKVNDCNQKLLELKETLRDLALDKFNNIVQDFTDEFELIGSASSFIDKQISLFEEAGQIIGKGFYEAQIDVSRKQRNLLEKEKAELINELSSSIANGYIQKGTDEWLEMVNSIKEVDESILDCDQSIEQLQNSILELSDQAFERLQNQFSSLKDQLNNINSLIDEIDVSDEEGVWSKEGMTRLGMFAEQYELARHNVEKYQEQIDQLNDSYANGLYSTTEYLDKLSELTEQQWSEALAAEDAKKSIMDLNKARVDLIKEGIQKQIDKYKELIDAQKKALDQDKDLHDWQKTLAEKNKNITKLQNQIAVLSNDDSASANAKRIKLQQELNEALEDLEETQYDHSIEKQKEALDQQMEDFEDERQKEIDALEEYLKDTEKVQKDSFEVIKKNTNAIAETIAELVKTHGVIVSETITNSWKQGENAIAAYGETLAVESSGFMSEINILELYLGGLQAEADITAAEVANIFTAKADSLVMELNSTRDTEMDLINATNMLQNALIKTLEGGYDNSRIINSLKEIQEEMKETQKVASGGDNNGKKKTDQPKTDVPEKETDTHSEEPSKEQIKQENLEQREKDAEKQLKYIEELNKQIEDVDKQIIQQQQQQTIDILKEHGRFQDVEIPDNINQKVYENKTRQLETIAQNTTTTGKLFRDEALYQQNEREKEIQLSALKTQFAYDEYWNKETGQYSVAYEQLARATQYSRQAAEQKQKIDDAIAEYKYKKAAISQMYNGYSVGVHKLKADEMAWTQELGQEAILSPTRNAILTKLNKGDTVLTAEQTDNLFKLSKIDPSTIFGKLKMPTYSSKTMTPVLTIGNVLTVNGNIDDTNVDKMKGFVNNAITKAFKDFSSEIIKR